MAAPIPNSVISPLLIGRAAHMAGLVHLFEQARAGRGQVAAVSGEAGVGKSRLVAEVIAHVFPRPIGDDQFRYAHVGPHLSVLRGRCFELDNVVTYAPLLDLMHGFCSVSPPEVIAQYLGPAVPDLVKVLPELARSFPNLVPGPALEPEQEKHRLFQVLTQFFFDLSDLRALLIVVEDIYWSDDASLEFLLYFAREISPHKILLLLTYRDDEIRSDLARFLSNLNRERIIADFSLAPLTEEESSELVRAVFALRAPAPADFLKPIYELTEGNPFFMEEVLKSLIRDGDITYTGGTWDLKPVSALRIPRTVQVAVQQRTGSLTPYAREVLEIAAVAGRRFDFELLRQLTEYSEPELLQSIKELTRAQLVVEESADSFAFRHALTREAVYSDMLSRERRTLHRSIAGTLERIHAYAPDAHLTELAYHFSEAQVWEKALEYGRRAGERAQALYSLRVAAEHFTRAIEAAKRLGSPMASLYHARGRSYDLHGDFEVARDDYVQAVDSAHQEQDVIAEWQSLLDLGWLWTSRDYEYAADYLRRAVELAREIEEPSKLAQTLNRVGNWYLNTEQPMEARHYHLDALAILQELDDQPALAATLDLLGITSFIGGDILAAVTYYEQAVALFRTLDDQRGLVASLETLSIQCEGYPLNLVVCPATDLSACLRSGEEALSTARRIDWRPGEASALAYLGNCLGPFGELTSALAYARAGLELASQIGHVQWANAAHLGLGGIYSDLLALPEAREHFKEALRLGKEMGSLTVMRIAGGFLASTYVAEGSLALAETVLMERQDDPSSGEAPRTIGDRFVMFARAELALSRGEAPAALALTGELVASALNVDYWGEGAIPRIWQLQGEALAALHRLDEAEAALLAARHVAGEQGMRPRLWRIVASLGRVYQAQGRRRQASEAFAEARSIIGSLAEIITDQSLRDNFARQANSQLPRLSEPSSRKRIREQYSGLTEREREVAALVAQGKSNRAISEQLFVGERTVAKHIESVLSKLDFRSRAQIAIWAVEKNLVNTGD